MKGIMQNLANQYRLVYSLQAPDDGKLHQIKVDAFQVVNDGGTNSRFASGRVGVSENQILAA